MRETFLTGATVGCHCFENPETTHGPLSLSSKIGPGRAFFGSGMSGELRQRRLMRTGTSGALSAYGYNSHAARAAPVSEICEPANSAGRRAGHITKGRNAKVSCNLPYVSSATLKT